MLCPRPIQSGNYDQAFTSICLPVYLGLSVAHIRVAIAWLVFTNRGAMVKLLFWVRARASARLRIRVRVRVGLT